MTSLCCYKNNLIIGFNDKIVFINIHSLNVSKNLKLPTPQKSNLIENPDDNDTEEGKLPTVDNAITVQKIEISPNGQYLAVATCGQKCLFLYKISEDNVELLSNRSVARLCSALTFSSDSQEILICDKTGDCYLYECIDYNSPGRWILGHLSIVYSVIFTPDKRFVITSDRDEKIRITKYPDTHEVEGYCLGHKEYVSQISLLPVESTDYLISLSGDKTIKIWDFKRCLKVHEFEVPAPGMRFSIRELSECICHVACQLYQPNESLYIYEITYTNGQFQSKQIASISLDSAIISHLCYVGENLYVTVMRENRLDIDVIAQENEEYVIKDSKDLKYTITSVFSDNWVAELEDVSLWFKKKFDNVSEYLERKKRRIEEKNAQ